jgi:hypothetical protein
MPTSTLSNDTFGADAEQLDSVARQLRQAADDLDDQAAALDSTLRSVAWVGGVATRFMSNWNVASRPRLASASSFLRDAAVCLDQNGGDQRLASAVQPRVDPFVETAGPVPTANSSPPVVTEGLDIADTVLEWLTSAHDIGDLLAEGGKELAALGLSDDLIQFLTDQTFIAALETLDKGVDVASVVVDFISDFVENPAGALDDRIVHALADSAMRFAVGEGVDKGVEWLVTTIGTTVLPGVGTVTGAMLGKVLGPIAQTVVGEVLDAVDGATDLIDMGADLFVDAYQGFKASVGVAVEVVGEVIHIGGDVVGGIADGADAIWDAGWEAGAWLIGA